MMTKYLGMCLPTCTSLILIIIIKLLLIDYASCYQYPSIKLFDIWKYGIYRDKIIEEKVQVNIKFVFYPFILVVAEPP